MALLKPLKSSLRWHKADVLRRLDRQRDDARIAGHGRAERHLDERIRALRAHPLAWWKTSYLGERVRELCDAPLFWLPQACASRLRQLDGGDGNETLRARGAADAVGLYHRLRLADAGRVAVVRASVGGAW